MITINGHRYEYNKFPNQELQMPIPKAGWYVHNKNRVEISFYYENNNDILALYFLKKYFDNKLVNVNIILNIYYFPYERMDRQTDNQMFTAKYFAEFINSMNFTYVFVLDPHSEVIMGVLNRTVKYELKNIIFYDIEEDFDYIFFPDIGAKKKYTEILAPLTVPYFYGEKHRDLDTGKISDYKVIDAPDLNGKTVLIIDDLCVKGYTTLNAAKALKKLGANKVIFYCSHCENAIYNGELLTTDYVDKIYTTNSLILNESHNKINIINI